MENFTMMLGYNPEVIYTGFLKKAECNTVLFQEAKKDNTNVFQEVCILTLHHKLS